MAGDTIYLKGTFNGGEAAGDVLDVRTLAGTAALPIRITATDPLNMPTFSVGITGSGKTLYNDYPSPGTTRFLVIDHIHFDGTNSASFDPRIELYGMDHLALRTITVDGAATNSPKGLRFRGIERLVRRERLRVSANTHHHQCDAHETLQQKSTCKHEAAPQF